MLKLIPRLSKAFTPTAIAPFTVFQSTGMLMARPVPLQFNPSEDNPTIAREGYVNLTVIPRHSDEASGEESKGSFDKEKKLNVKLRSKQIGQLISWRLGNGKPSPLVINAFMTGSVPTTIELKFVNNTLGEDVPEIQMTITPKSGDASPVTIPISLGEVKSLQILLESCLPDLYGWTGKMTSPRQTSTWSGASTNAEKSPEDFFNQFK